MQNSRVQVELFDNTKYLVIGVGTIPCQLELSNSLYFDSVLFVQCLKKHLLSISVMEDKGLVGGI